MRAPSARSLILDLLSSLRGRSMPVSALVASGGFFEIAENSIRVAVARLLAADQIERDERGRYRLGAQADPVDRRVRRWRSRVDVRTDRWNGGWIGVLSGSPRKLRGREAKLQERALRMLGFRTLMPGMSVRPDNLGLQTDEIRSELCDLGLEPASLVCVLGDLDRDSEHRARGLWDTEGLQDGYQRSRERLEESLKQLTALDEPDAMVESFLIGGHALRQLVLDPQLPESILPGAARTSLVESMRRYDDAGRLVWAGFMSRHGAPHFGTPAHTRAGESWSLS